MQPKKDLVSDRLLLYNVPCLLDAVASDPGMRVFTQPVNLTAPKPWARWSWYLHVRYYNVASAALEISMHVRTDSQGLLESSFMTTVS